MKLQSLPLHPISFRILTYQYKNNFLDGVLKVTARDPLSYQFGIIPNGRKEFYRKKQQRLTTEIKIWSSIKIENPSLVGFVLYQMHVSKILSEVRSMCMVNLNAMENLRLVCSKYLINDDDFDIESLARAWRRDVRGSKIEEIRNNIAYKPMRKRHKNMQISYRFLSFSLDDCNECIRKFVELHLRIFKTKNGVFSQTLYQSLQSYVYYTFGKMNQEFLSELFNIDQSNVSRRIENWRMYISNYNKLEKSIQNIFEAKYNDITSPVVAN